MFKSSIEKVTRILYPFVELVYVSDDSLNDVKFSKLSTSPFCRNIPLASNVSAATTSSNVKYIVPASISIVKPTRLTFRSSSTNSDACSATVSLTGVIGLSNMSVKVSLVNDMYTSTTPK